MTQLWDDRKRYQVWLEIELAVCQELASAGRIPKNDWLLLKRKVDQLLAQGGIDPARVEHHEAITRHDVIAFTTAVAERIGPVSRYIHFGLTSSDVVDTAFSILIQNAIAVLENDIRMLLGTLKTLAKKYQHLPTIGRSHGMFAEPTSFGLKFLGWYCEWQRNLERLTHAKLGICVGKLSGAVGVNAHWSPAFEKKVLAKLNLKRESVSTQVIPRDRHAEVLSVLALCGASLERIAIELRHLQRSEVSEVMEGFRRGQKGSSAMPHKRNPISSENLTGCARLLRSYAQSAYENIPLWHERDISHSSVERVTFPDATILLDYAIHRMNGILENLDVNEERIKKNLEAAGPVVFSGHFLLELVKLGATREDAYAWVQECALSSLKEHGSFIEKLIEHPEIAKRISKNKIRELGSLKHQLRHVNEIYKAALKK